MSFTTVLLLWAERYGNPVDMMEWVNANQFDTPEASSLSDIGRKVVERFVAHHSSKVPAVAVAHPEFVEWYTGTGATLIRESVKYLRVHTEADLVEIIGMVRYLKHIIDNATTLEDQWTWLVDTLGQLHSGLEEIGVLEKPARYELTMGPMQFLTAGSRVEHPSSVVIAPAGGHPAGVSSFWIGKELGSHGA